MRTGFWRRLDQAASALAPAAMTAALAIVAILHSRVPGFNGIAPALPVTAVYFWSIYRPQLIPSAVVFAIGLLVDLLSATPLGVYALVLLAVRLAVTSQRRFFLGKSFLIVWWGFMLVAAGAGLLAWALMCLNAGTLVLTAPAFYQYLQIGRASCRERV